MNKSINLLFPHKHNTGKELTDFYFKRKDLLDPNTRYIGISSKLIGKSFGDLFPFNKDHAYDLFKRVLETDS